MGVDMTTNRQERFDQLVEDLQTLGTTQSKMGTDILRDLWEIYRLGLYSTESYNLIADNGEVSKERFETFLAFCNTVVRGFYDPPEYFDKFKYVVDRVFRYVHMRYSDGDPIIIPLTSDPLTVDLLINTPGWIAKLIIISNKFEMCQTDEEIESLFFAGIEGDADDVKEAGDEIQDKRTPIRIDYVERVVADSRYTLLFEAIDQEQYDTLTKKMGKILIKHMD
jgi:hypothetical protein